MSVFLSWAFYPWRLALSLTASNNPRECVDKLPELPRLFCFLLFFLRRILRSRGFSTQEQVRHLQVDMTWCIPLPGHTATQRSGWFVSKEDLQKGSKRMVFILASLGQPQKRVASKSDALRFADQILAAGLPPEPRFVGIFGLFQ